MLKIPNSSISSFPLTIEVSEPSTTESMSSESLHGASIQSTADNLAQCYPCEQNGLKAKLMRFFCFK
jgi:hypothetical protein